MKKNLILSIVLVLASVCAFAQKPAMVMNDKKGWHKISEVVVSFEKETDEVDVMIADKFASIKFKVTDSPIELLDLVIIFEDGQKQNVTIGKRIKKAGESSPEIDIDGAGERQIDRILLRYKTIKQEGGSKKAHVEIWGKKTNDDKKAKKPKKEKSSKKEKPKKESEK